MATRNASGQRRRYTREERDEILRDAAVMGHRAAAEKHGMPPTTISTWKNRGLWRKPGAAASSVEGTSSVTAELAAATSVAVDARPASSSVSARVQSERPAAQPTRSEGANTSSSGRARGKGVARRYTPSERARALEAAAKRGVSAAAMELDVSRFSIYAWQKRVTKAAAGEGPSPTSGPEPAEVEAQGDREILAEWRKHPGLGPSQIRNQLRRGGVKVGVQTVRRVMEEQGYRPPRVKRDPHDERFEAVRPNHMWHLDFVHRHINRASTFTLILIDDCSRYVVGHGVDESERADMVIETFEAAVQRHGKPEMVLNDKGSAFWSWRGIGRFTSLLTEYGVDQIEAEHKEWNGKVEVFNANLHKELFDVHRFYDVAEMRRRLAAHLHWYNHARTHHALGGLLVPADRFYGQSEAVLARIEAGAGRELDLLELRSRCLELFKVVSQGGVPEVWLLGKKLLELKTP